MRLVWAFLLVLLVVVECLNHQTPPIPEGNHPPMPPHPHGGGCSHDPQQAFNATGTHRHGCHVREHKPPRFLIGLFTSIVLGIVMSHILRESNIPYTIVMFGVGALTGLCAKVWGIEDYVEIKSIDPDLYLFIFLPLLIFESSFNTDYHTFKRVLIPAIIFAGPGLILASILTAVVSMWYYHGWQYTNEDGSTAQWSLVHPIAGWNWSAAMLFGSILSATDPVAVVALLKELGADTAVSTIIEGESLLNDGVAIVMFTVFIETVPNPDGFDFGKAVLAFLKIAGGGTAIGVVMGFVTTHLLIRVFNDAFVEVTVVLCIAYITFYCSQAFFGVSGVLACVAMGIVLSSRKASISPEVEHFMHVFWEILVWFANTVIFMIMGIQIIERATSVSGGDWIALIGLYISINVIRFLSTFALLPITRLSSYKITVKNAVLISWGGLRGAVGLALALIVENTATSNKGKGDGYNIPREVATVLGFHVSGIVMSTLVINGITTGKLVNALGLNKVSKMRKVATLNAVNRLAADMKSHLKVLHSDRYLADAHWIKATQLTVDKMEFPYTLTDDMLLEDFNEKARVMGLRIFKCAVNDLRKQGVIRRQATRRLLEYCADIQRQPGEFLTSSGLLDKGKPSLLQKLAIQHPEMPILRNIADSYYSQLFSLGFGFVNSLAAVEHKLDHVVVDETACEALKAKCSKEGHECMVEFHSLAAGVDEVALAAKSKIAARTVLNNAREKLVGLFDECALETNSYLKLRGLLEKHMQQLSSKIGHRQKALTPDQAMMQAAWFAEESEDIRVSLKEQSTTMSSQEGDQIYEQGTIHSCASVVLFGTVRCEGATGDCYYLGPGQTFGIVSALTHTPHQEAIHAETNSSYQQFPAEVLEQHMKQSENLSNNLWLTAGRGIAYSVLQNVLPYATWTTGKLRLHCESIKLEKQYNNEARQLKLDGARDYILLFGSAKVSANVITEPAPCLLLEECTVEADGVAVSVPHGDDPAAELSEAICAEVAHVQLADNTSASFASNDLSKSLLASDRLNDAETL